MRENKDKHDRDFDDVDGMNKYGDAVEDDSSTSDLLENVEGV